MVIVSLDEYEEKAAEKLDRVTFDYFRGGAGDEYTMSLNRNCFNK
jgi:hypothetical protein